METERDYQDMAPGDEVPPDTEASGEDVCPTCGGTGRVEGGECPECGGTGFVTEGVGGG
jgi:DnaJ-class molecular chaperone